MKSTDMNQNSGSTTPTIAAGCQTEVAVLAGGCFWGVEDILRDVAGVIDTDVGYTGGWLENPTYDDTHDSKSGHANRRADVRSVGAQLRRSARAVVLQAARPDHAQPSGQRRGTVSLSDLPQTPEQKATAGG